MTPTDFQRLPPRELTPQPYSKGRLVKDRHLPLKVTLHYEKTYLSVTNQEVGAWHGMVPYSWSHS